MKKIIIAIEDDFRRKLYKEQFTKNDFQVIEAKSGEEVIDLSREESPSLIFLDTDLNGFTGLDTLEDIKKDPEICQIPVVVYSPIKRSNDWERAMDLEAKDFLTGTGTSPQDAAYKIKAILGDQKMSYILPVSSDLESFKQLADHLGYKDMKCKSCGYSLTSLQLLSDISKGRNYFTVSLICPGCIKKGEE